MNARGFTLVEWLIAMLIGAFLVGGGLSIFVASRATTEEAFDQSELQENGRVAMRLLTQDLKWAGFWGDYTGSPMTVGQGVTLLGGITSACGSLPSNAGTRALLVMRVNGSGSLAGGDSSCIPTESSKWSFIENTDVISIKRLIGRPLTIDSTLDEKRFYLATTTEEANLFSITEGSNSIPDEVIKMTEPQLWEYQHLIYYIALNKLNNIPEMRKRFLTPAGGSFQIGGPVAEGIERLNVLFGVDDSLVPDGVIDRYVSTNDVSEQAWSEGRVVAARIFILVRSLQASRSYVNDNVYQVGDVSVSGNGDGFRRLLLETSVSLRNPAVIAGGGS
ncbi:PilW family protein [Aeromonas bivalvium]|uniref:PilW family protein n=1 Tax=Aeromonas bivalvium TaxID=440079 RepID=UPI000A03BDE8|nr:PilW family protein [Aeromonas bivalvium]